MFNRSNTRAWLMLAIYCMVLLHVLIPHHHHGLNEHHEHVKHVHAHSGDHHDHDHNHDKHNSEKENDHQSGHTDLGDKHLAEYLGSKMANSNFDSAVILMPQPIVAISVLDQVLLEQIARSKCERPPILYEQTNVLAHGLRGPPASTLEIA